jgi:hypothetical protein
VDPEKVRTALALLEQNAQRKNVMKEFWDERFADEEFVYGTDPNEWFAFHLENLKPGKAFFPAEGEGRNAVYAARKGWQVHAFDFSESAARKAGKLADKNGVNLSYMVCGWEEFPWKPGTYDLVVLSYVHLPPEARKKLHQKVIESLKAGGTVLLEAFSPKQLHYRSGGPKNPDWLFSLSDVKNDFFGLNIIQLREELVELKEGPGHNGEASVVRMQALKN